MKTSQSIKPYSIRPKAEYIYTMNNEEIEALVKKEMSSYIFNPKMSLDEYERKLEKTFDYCVFDRNKSEKHRQAFRSLRKRFGIAEETHIYELIENEQSAVFYAGFRYGENSTYPILFFKSFSIVSEGCYLSNCGDFSTFLIIYQGIDETGGSDSEDDNYKNMYYQSVWAFNNVVYDRIRENIYKEFYIPRVYY